MAILKQLIALLVTTASATLGAYNPGWTMSIDNDSMKRAKLDWGRIILASLNKVVVNPIILPNDMGELNNNTYHLGNFTYDQLTVEVVPENNTVIATIRGIPAKWHTGDFHVKKGILRAHGEVDVVDYNCTVACAFKMTSIPSKNDPTRILN